MEANFGLTSGRAKDFLTNFARFNRLQEFIALNGNPPGFSNIAKITTSMSQGQAEMFGSSLINWLDNTVQKHGLEALTTLGVDMDDLRVREYARDEVLSNRNWLSHDMKLISTSSDLNVRIIKSLSPISTESLFYVNVEGRGPGFYNQKTAE
jgi:hypothetical protein